MARSRLRPRRPRFRPSTAFLIALGMVATTFLQGAASFRPAASADWSDVAGPVQQAGSAAGRSHAAPAAATTAGEDGRSRTPKPPKGALPPQRAHEATPADRTGVRAPHLTPATSPAKPRRVAAAPERSRVSGFDGKTSAEMPARRSRFAYTYQNADGTYTTKTYTSPVNFRGADGSWQPIDTRLVSSQGRWRNKSDSHRVNFAAHAGPADVVSMDLGAGRTFGFGVSGAAAAPAQITGDTATYREVRPDADLVVEALAGGSVKEKIVLRSARAPSRWVFPLRTNGLTPRSAPDGGLELIDAAGNVAATIPPGFMEDANRDPRSGDGARSEAVTYRLLRAGAGGGWQLELTADPAWLADPARVYPVTSDPTAVWNNGDTKDTYVQSGRGSSASTENQLKAGTYDGGSTKAATYLGFSNVDDNLRHSQIFDADLYLFNFWSYSCEDRAVSVHPVLENWSESTPNSRGPPYGAALGSRSFATGWIPPGAGSSPCPAKWQPIDLGDGGNALVQDWVDDKKDVFGLTVRASTTSSYGWKKFSSRETPNGPYLAITYSPYRATYAFTTSPPVVNPPVLNNQAGNVPVKVTNIGHETWTPTNGYKLTYKVYDEAGQQIYHQSAETALPATVAYGQTATVNAKINPLPPGKWTVKFDMVRTTSSGFALFSEWGVPRTAQLSLTVPDVPSKLTAMHPLNNYEVGTLRPQLFAAATSVDAWPTDSVKYWFTMCAPPYLEWEWCESSNWQTTPKWTPPAGKLTWSKEYYWTVAVSDSGGAVTYGPWYKFTTAVPQPAVTSHLAGPAVAGQEFHPQIGNYTTTATDATVATVGPPLTLVRTYNSLDPRVDGAFGAGWTTRYDMRVVPDADGTGNAVVTYPDGQQVRFAKNTDGSFSPPPGRYATFAALTGGGWRLMDKAATSYIFDAAGRLTSITDHRGRAQTLTYGTDGKLAKATNAGGRSLSFTWSGGHVVGVSTNPVGGTSLTWTYTYTGNLLTAACSPAAAPNCTTYTYGGGSHYRNMALDDIPAGYWRLGEAGGTTMTSAIGANLGSDSGTYSGGVGLGGPGVLAGPSNAADMFWAPTAPACRLGDRTISRMGPYLSVEA